MAEQNSSSQIEQFVRKTTALATHNVFDNNLWQHYGYSKRPLGGTIAKKLFPKKYILQDYIFYTLLCMGLADIAVGLRKSNVSSGVKIALLMGILDLIITLTSDDVDPDLLVGYFVDMCKGREDLQNQDPCFPIITRAEVNLKGKDLSRFVTGTLKVFYLNNRLDFLLNSDVVEQMVNDSSLQGSIGLSMEKDRSDKYVKLIFDKLIL